MRIAIAVRDGSKPAKFDYCKFLVKPTVPASKWVHSCKRQKSLPAKPPTVVEPLFYSIVTVLPTWNIIWHLSQIYTLHNWTRIYSTFATLESSRFSPLYFTFCNKPKVQSLANLKKYIEIAFFIKFDKLNLRYFAKSDLEWDNLDSWLLWLVFSLP